MNIREINEFRVSHGLTPLTPNENKGKAQRQNANKAARAQACRDLKSLRSSGRKAK
jgi:uncharacterized protein YkwD